MNLDAGSILVIIGLLVLNLLLAVIFIPQKRLRPANDETVLWKRLSPAN